MAKLTPAQMKKAVEEFKKKFTPDFYHASGSNKIKEFDPSKSKKDPDMITPGVTFLTSHPDFTLDHLPVNKKGDYLKGATVYPVSANLGKHFDIDTPEGLALAESYYKQNNFGSPDKFIERLSDPLNNWKTMESPDFLDHLKNTGHDSFSVTEGGFRNVGIFDPKNIRGKFAKFNPEDAESADFMKAAGGRIVKKALEHARQVPFVHYSNAPNISTLDPNRYGTGIKGAEAGRLKNEPDIRPRTFFYTKAGGRKPEQGLGPHKYEGVADNIYPLHDDPAGFSAIAKQKAIDPYMMSMGREVVDEATHLNELERLIKQAGYKGYANDDVGLLFDPTPVIRSE